MSAGERPLVLVLGGGPDAEREVSLRSAAAVAQALRDSGRFGVAERTIERITGRELAGSGCEVVFPVLHGRWGEGGPLQDELESSGLPYVGCGPEAARLCMDKMAAKLAAARAGVATLAAAVLDPSDPTPTVGLPCVVKPVHEGSSVGLHVCRTIGDWGRAREEALASPDLGARLVERMAAGREVTCGLLLDGREVTALPLVEVRPASGVYDFEAKYGRGDTGYVVEPELPGCWSEEIPRRAEAVAFAAGVRGLCRVDFILDAGEAWFLEVNTLPWFTATSLLPMAAARRGLEMPGMAAWLEDGALGGCFRGEKKGL